MVSNTQIKARSFCLPPRISRPSLCQSLCSSGRSPSLCSRLCVYYLANTLVLLCFVTFLPSFAAPAVTPRGDAGLVIPGCLKTQVLRCCPRHLLVLLTQNPAGPDSQPNCRFMSAMPGCVLSSHNTPITVSPGSLVDSIVRLIAIMSWSWQQNSSWMSCKHLPCCTMTQQAEQNVIIPGWEVSLQKE